MWLSELRTQHSVHEDGGSIHGLPQWLKYPCHKLKHKSQMWLKSGVAMAVAWVSAAALIGYLAWDLLYVTGAAVERK